MSSSEYRVVPIGVIETEYESSESTPIQPIYSQSVGRAIINPEYSAGLKSLELFSHGYLIYWFDRAKKPELLVTPYLDDRQHGVFATRVPSRPNPIGISIVEFIEVGRHIIVFRGADMLNGTPLLDIKPYISKFDDRKSVVDGWIKEMSSDDERYIADDRFEE